MSDTTEKPAPTLAELMEQLAVPFQEDAIYWKPQATTRDKSRAMGVPYADTRAYEDQLNAVCPDDWATAAAFQPVNGSRLACVVHLTIAGVTRAGDGESPANDDNAATSAYAQAFKRACSRFSLGRYLYDVPKKWVAYDNEKRRITDAGEQELRRMYRAHVYSPAASQGNGNSNGSAPKASADGYSPAASQGYSPAASQGNGSAPKANANVNGNGSTPKADANVNGNSNWPPPDYRSNSQWVYITRLFKQLGVYSEAEMCDRLAAKGFDPATLTKKQAGIAINRLKAAVAYKKEEKEQQPV